jgi:hypothetical protein
MKIILYIQNSILSLWNKLKLRRKQILFSMGFSCVLIFIGYFVNNSSLFTGEAAHKMYILEKISKYIGIPQSDSIPNDVVYFNIGYDKCLTPVVVNGDTVGVTQITDRYKVNSFLKLLRKCNNYKYIVLDVFFDKKDNATFPNDSLCETLSAFGNRIILADRDSTEFAYPQLIYLTAKARFDVTKISKAFSRYKYIINGESTMPLRLYENLNDGVKIKRIGLLDWAVSNPYIKDIFSLYFLDNKLIQNSLFLQFDEYSIAEGTVYETYDDGTRLYLFDYQNGSEFIGNNIENPDILLSDLVNNKIVVIGDLTNGDTDSHSTYMDTKKGSEILVKAYSSINDGLLDVSFAYLLFWFVIFSVVSYIIISDKPILCRFKIFNNISNKFVRFSLSLISYSIIISLAMICEYFIFNRTYSLIIPIILFSILKFYIQYKHYDTSYDK